MVGFVGLIRKSTKHPSIWKYDSSTNECIDLKFPYANLDGKPHVKLMEDKNQRIWYKSNYSGICKYEEGRWTKENNKSGALGVSKDGNVYLSYEVRKYTQIASFFKYTEDNYWQLVASSRGYGIPMASMERED